MYLKTTVSFHLTALFYTLIILSHNILVSQQCPTASLDCFIMLVHTSLLVHVVVGLMFVYTCSSMHLSQGCCGRMVGGWMILRGRSHMVDKFWGGERPLAPSSYTPE